MSAPDRIWAWEYKGNTPWGEQKPDLKVVHNGSEYVRLDPNTRVVTVTQLDRWAVAIQAGLFWRYADEIRAIIGEVKP